MYVEFQPRDSRDGRPSPGMTSMTAVGFGAGAGAGAAEMVCSDARLRIRAEICVVGSMLKIEIKVVD